MRRSCIISLGLALVLNSAFASEIYDVEVLVFMQSSPLQDERWPEAAEWPLNKTPLLLLRPDPQRKWEVIESDIAPDLTDTRVQVNPLLLENVGLSDLSLITDPDGTQSNEEFNEDTDEALGIDETFESFELAEDDADVAPVNEPAPVVLWQQRSPLALADNAERLQQRGYVTLWHQRWYQEINENNPGLYISAQTQGMSVQGWLEFSHQRYVHFKTQLLAIQQREKTDEEIAEQIGLQNDPQNDPLEEPEPTLISELNQQAVVGLSALAPTQTDVCSIALAPLLSRIPAMGEPDTDADDDNTVEQGQPEYDSNDCLMRPEQVLQLNEELWRIWPFIASRRMQSGETHYLDHPLFGVIVRISPYSGE